MTATKPRWDGESEQMLIQCWGDDLAELAEALNRTERAVVLQAHRLRLPEAVRIAKACNVPYASLAKLIVAVRANPKGQIRVTPADPTPDEMTMAYTDGYRAGFASREGKPPEYAHQALRRAWMRGYHVGVSRRDRTQEKS